MRHSYKPSVLIQNNARKEKQKTALPTFLQPCVSIQYLQKVNGSRQENKITRMALSSLVKCRQLYGASEKVSNGYLKQFRGQKLRWTKAAERSASDERLTSVHKTSFISATALFYRRNRSVVVKRRRRHLFVLRRSSTYL